MRTNTWTSTSRPMAATAWPFIPTLAYAGERTDWPAYDIEAVDADRYRIVLAVPGLKEADLEITSEANRLTITGRAPAGETGATALFRGIATGPFTRVFDLARHVRVESARLADGLLTLELLREIPEELRPKRIPIANEDGGPAPPAEASANAA